MPLAPIIFDTTEGTVAKQITRCKHTGPTEIYKIKYMRQKVWVNSFLEQPAEMVHDTKHHFTKQQ